MASPTDSSPAAAGSVTLSTAQFQQLIQTIQTTAATATNPSTPGTSAPASAVVTPTDSSIIVPKGDWTDINSKVVWRHDWYKATTRPTDLVSNMIAEKGAAACNDSQFLIYLFKALATSNNTSFQTEVSSQKRAWSMGKASLTLLYKNLVAKKVLDDSETTVGRDLLCLFLDVSGKWCRRLMHAHLYYDAPPRLRNVIKEVGWHEASAAGQ
eukprot:scaffold19951_cov142-Skeletonema_dohrnii-CCMP3373.AAC.2